jgi:hypothetical protein
MVEEKIIIDMLTKDSVAIKTQKFYDGQPVGEPHCVGYANNTSGRKNVDLLGEPYKTAILAIWGNTPTVEDITLEKLEGMI